MGRRQAVEVDEEEEDDDDEYRDDDDDDEDDDDEDRLAFLVGRSGVTFIPFEEGPLFVVAVLLLLSKVVVMVVVSWRPLSA